MDGNLPIRPRARVLWNREWADVKRSVSGRFASDSSTGLSPFTVEGTELPRDHAELALGWDVGFTELANLYIEWQGRFGEDLIENALTVGGRVRW